MTPKISNGKYPVTSLEWADQPQRVLEAAEALGRFNGHVLPHESRLACSEEIQRRAHIDKCFEDMLKNFPQEP